MAIFSDVQLCNLALGHMGDRGTIESLDIPTKANELIFAKWYDVSRQAYLKKVMPNFAMSRQTVAVDAAEPSLVFSYSFPFPSGCLKVLGIGEIQDKVNNYTIESNKIWTNVEYNEGLPVRFIKDVTDISMWTPEALLGFSWFLAAQTAMEVTSDINILSAMIQKSQAEMVSVSGINAQENMPIRISRSKNRQARVTGYPFRYNKK